MKGKKMKGVPIANFPVDPTHKLMRAMNRINWDVLSSNKNNTFQEAFKPLQPIRRIFGLMVLESIRGVEGEELLTQWMETPVMQYFTGEELFHWELPITSEELDMCRMQLSNYGLDVLESMINEAK